MIRTIASTIMLLLQFLSYASAQEPITVCSAAISNLGYAETFKAALYTPCQAITNRKLPLCTRLKSMPNSRIEAAALPHFTQYVTKQQCKDITRFYSSSIGIGIKLKLISSIKHGAAPMFSNEEIDVLDDFNKSESGVALGRLADNRNISSAIIRTLSE